MEAAAATDPDDANDAAPMSDGRKRGLLLVDAPLHSGASANFRRQHNDFDHDSCGFFKTLCGAVRI